MKYGKIFYDYVNRTARESAEALLVPVVDALQATSLVDFGCGEGMWLSVAKSHFPKVEILGFDGDYVEPTNLKIEKNYFHAADLTQYISVPKKYDLAISLEVAEHIPSEKSDVFLDNLCNASDTVLFSAAIPG